MKILALEFSSPQRSVAVLHADERGRVLRIDRMENDASHQLIEEFMLLANEIVATRAATTRAIKTTITAGACYVSNPTIA